MDSLKYSTRIHFYRRCTMNTRRLTVLLVVACILFGTLYTNKRMHTDTRNGKIHGDRDIWHGKKDVGRTNVDKNNWNGKGKKDVETLNLDKRTRNVNKDVQTLNLANTIRNRKNKDTETMHLNGNSSNGRKDARTRKIHTWKHALPYHKHDFLSDPPFKFDDRFKNPCWYEGTRLRCLPYCLIYGVRKSGTTSLFAHLWRHPDFVDWGKKESQFFGHSQKFTSNATSANISAYVDIFEKATRKIHQTSLATNTSRKNTKIIVDGSPDTMYANYDWTQFPGNENLMEPKILTSDYVHHFMPNAKVILVIRDPVERLYSEYYFVHGTLFKINNTNKYTFHSYVEFLINKYNDCFRHNTVRGCVYNITLMAPSTVPAILLNLGIYYVYMEDTYRVFGKDNVLVLHMEEVGTIPGLRKVFKFLDLESLPYSKMKRVVKYKTNARRDKYKMSGPMLNVTRELLTDFYQPFNERMAELMNDDYYLFRKNT